MRIGDWSSDVCSSDLPDYLRAIGTVRAVEGVDVAPQVAGIVKEIAFEANDRVKAGQLIVQLDDAVEQANVALYQAQVPLGQRTLDRVTAMRSRGNAAIGRASCQDRGCQSVRIP